MAATTRIKVGREKLLKKLRAERDRIVAKHERAEEKYRADMYGFRERLLVALADYRSKIDGITDPVEALANVENRGYGKSARGIYVPLAGIRVPDKPEDLHRSTHKLDRLIATLEMAEDDQISIAADDAYADYL